MKLEHAVAAALLVLTGGKTMAQGADLTYFGRSSIKIEAAGGFTIYVDPYAPGDYGSPADLILVTHGHDDHNDVSLVKKKKPGCVVIAPRGAVEGEATRVIAEGETVRAGTAKILAVPAYNRNHPRGTGVGYVIAVGGIEIYHAGDTSLIPEMGNLSGAGIDLALFPSDGKWNMGGEEAAKCAVMVGARQSAAIHSSPDGLHDERRAGNFSAPGAVKLAPGTKLKIRGTP